MLAALVEWVRGVAVAPTLIIHRVDNKFAADGHVRRVPTVKMLPDSVGNDFVVEALHDCALDPVTIRPFRLKQAPILDAPRPLIEQLGLLIIVLDGLGQRGKRALLVYR